MRRAVCQRQLSFLSLSWEWVSQEVAGGFFIATEGAAITALEENSSYFRGKPHSFHLCLNPATSVSIYTEVSVILVLVLL